MHTHTHSHAHYYTRWLSLSLLLLLLLPRLLFSLFCLLATKMTTMTTTTTTQQQQQQQQRTTTTTTTPVTTIPSQLLCVFLWNDVMTTLCYGQTKKRQTYFLMTSLKTLLLLLLFLLLALLFLLLFLFSLRALAYVCVCVTMRVCLCRVARCAGNLLKNSTVRTPHTAHTHTQQQEGAENRVGAAQNGPLVLYVFALYLLLFATQR